MAFKKNEQPLSIAVIGGGFCGVLTAIHLLQCKSANLHIHVINKGYILAKGVAYEPHTDSLLLNVPNGRMSAFPDMPDHYVLWLQKQYPDFNFSENIHNEFSPRKLYGEYLASLLDSAIQNKHINKSISFHDNYAEDICDVNGLLKIILEGGTQVIANKIVLATGNGKPRLPKGVSKLFEKSNLYHANPWSKKCLANVDHLIDILIIGAGLTTVDTIIGLEDNGFNGKIHTISPNGYRLKPWKENKIAYSHPFIDNIYNDKYSLLQLLIMFNKHRKIAVKLDQSFYPLIDSLRPCVQKLWHGFNLTEKQQFIRHIKPFWEKVRHRLPTEQYNRMEDLLKSGKLVTHKGRIVSINESGNKALTTLNIDGELKEFIFSRVVNCTGPETDIRKIDDLLLNNLSKKGWICPGPCNLGINACPDNGNIITINGDIKVNITVIGNQLKGILWESTAVPELRTQAKKVASYLLKDFITQAV
ncbi:FAD/NAD(P)-binding protein [Mucilaginibacter sp.]